MPAGLGRRRLPARYVLGAALCAAVLLLNINFVLKSAESSNALREENAELRHDMADMQLRTTDMLQKRSADRERWRAAERATADAKRELAQLRTGKPVADGAREAAATADDADDAVAVASRAGLRYHPRAAECSRPAPAASVPRRDEYEPLAEPASQVVVGGGRGAASAGALRITVLSATTLRLERAGASGGFDERASMAVVHRRLPRVSYSASVGPCELLPSSSRCLVVETANLRLEQAVPEAAAAAAEAAGALTPQAEGGYAAAWVPAAPGEHTLRVRLRLGGGHTEWWPGKANPRQLPGTIRTLDKVNGKSELRCHLLAASLRRGSDNAHCAMGVISRDGWALLDDSKSTRLDGASMRGGWEWASPRDAEAAAAEALAREADADPRCAAWAASGECERNAAFMKSTCRPACERAAAKAKRTADGGVGSDWYLFASGLDFKASLRDLSLLSGAQPIPPRYAFGVWYSRWWPVADWEALALEGEFEAHGTPLDVLITDMDWHHTCYRRTYGSEEEKSMDASHNWPCWSGFSWDKKYYATPEAFLGASKAAGVHNGLNLHFQSGVLREEDSWAPFAAEMRLPASAEFAEFAPHNKTYSSAFHRHVLGPLERQGVDFWWLDWQQGEGLFGGSDTPELNPTLWLNHVYGTQPDGRGFVRRGPGADGPPAAAVLREGAAAAAARWHDRAARRSTGSRRRRRLIMHRWGGYGNQRYPIGFSGDVTASWASLAFQPEFTASAANVNFGYWSHDVGGFYEGAGPTLYTRWVQLGCLSPIFRAHGFRSTEIVKKFWLFPHEAFTAMRDALRLRLELLPHLYTAARAAHDGGPSAVRPLYHEYPELDEAYTHPGQYFFGSSMVAAPVTSAPEAGAPLTRVSLWVPPGRWVLMHSGVATTGPATLRQGFALDEIPLLVLSGAPIFGQPPPDVEWDHCGEGSRGWLGRAQRVPRCPQVAVWLPPPPSAGEAEAEAQRLSGEATLYEDDGWSEAYIAASQAQPRATRWTTVEWAYPPPPPDAASPLELTVTIGSARGCLAARDAVEPVSHAAVPDGDEGGEEYAGGDDDGGGGGEGGGGDGAAARMRSWRLLLHGIPPPTSAVLVAAGSPAGSSGEVLRFADPAAAERWRKADERRSPLWLFDAARLCVVVWLFDVPASEAVELRLGYSARAAELASAGLQHSADAARGVMRRAQAAKLLLDATYPETQPQDYDQATWLAGLGARLAARPSNFTAEMAALPALVAAARAQVRDEPTRRVTTSINVARVRNATALLVES